MHSFKIIGALIAVAFALNAQAPVLAQASKTPSASQTIAPSGGGHTPAQPGDTCLGASACNTLIVECVTSGHDFKPIESGPKGEPTYGQCVKRTD